jgi:hypothetical protein
MIGNTASLGLDGIRSVLAENGYEVTPAGEHLRVTDLDSGIVIRVVIEDNILFSTVVLMSVDNERLTTALMRMMLDAENGIATSHFQLYSASAIGRTSITLNNFCKLQSLGEEDIDDILSCLQFLEIDAYAARDLLAAELGQAQDR